MGHCSSATLPSSRAQRITAPIRGIKSYSVSLLSRLPVTPSLRKFYACCPEKILKSPGQDLACRRSLADFSVGYVQGKRWLQSKLERQLNDDCFLVGWS